MNLFFFAAFLLTFILTAAAERVLIPILKSHKMGQKILEIGPRWHKSKEGTPTMGGLAFIIGSVIIAAAAFLYGSHRFGSDGGMFGEDGGFKLLLTLAMAYLNGLIGFIDDYSKFIKKRNEGLSAPQKYFLQLIVAGAYLAAMEGMGYLGTELYIPYLGQYYDIGILYYIFALILITGIVNAANLTDGVDGLAGSVTFLIAAFFAAAAFTLGSWQAALCAALTMGSCLGFLAYNFYPAKVFMGDTGSLFLGGMVAGTAFIINNPLIVVVAAVIYIIESVTVILQVAYFKLTHGRRLFLMTPIHHHFEKKGWSEIKIVAVFSAITAAGCAAAYFGL